VFSIEPLIISEGVFQGLDPAMQEAMLAAGAAATEHSAKFLRESEASIKEDLVAKGMEITEPDEADWIAKATEAVWPKFYDSIGGKEKLDAAMSILGRS
jgi:TRAP-type C4-dicarboxylate transport system substrate-binding protein